MFRKYCGATNLNWSPASRGSICCYWTTVNFSVFQLLFCKGGLTKILRHLISLFTKFYNIDLWRQRCGHTVNKLIITWGQYGLQDGNSPIMEELIFLHDFINMILMFIIRFVGYIIASMIKNSFINKNLLEMQIVERV